MRSTALLTAMFAGLATATSAQALTFERACAPASQTLVVGAIGDFLMHTPLQNAGNAGGYQKLWRGVQSRISQVGLMYGNLETPTAPDKRYGSYPAFNTSPALLDAIKSSGFDVVSTANNHALDRGSSGVDSTIEELEKRGLSFTGTRPAGSGNGYSVIVNRGGISVGFIACTYSTNGIPDKQDQVLKCYEQKSRLMNEIANLRRRVDAVIVTPHWGEEYQHTPNGREKKLARELIEAGAVAVIGTHPHVIQPIEKYTTGDGREGFIAYSTGNFISSQGGVKKIGLMLFIGLSKMGGDTWVNGARYSPTYMTGAGGGVQWLESASPGSMSVVRKVVKDPEGLLSPGDALVTNPGCR